MSLRGDANVTILVDGKPSALFDGPSRGRQPAALPADQIERVEVMTNPSAAFRPGGHGRDDQPDHQEGRPRRRPTRSGQGRANFGTGGPGSAAG